MPSVHSTQHATAPFCGVLGPELWQLLLPVIAEATFVEIKVYSISDHPQFDFIFIVTKRRGSSMS